MAEAEGRWLALLGWHAAALMCAPRDRWIGWPRPLQFQRMHLIANNSRFLILPGVAIPHLASRVLGLSLRRLSGDWQTYHGHPLLLAESFVDPTRFRDTCYRAANWLCLGESCGFARHAGQYRYHGQPKTVWVYTLHRRARPWLCDKDLQAHPWAATPPQAHTQDKSHGRLELRSIQATTALNQYLRFPHVAQTCRIERTVFYLTTGQSTGDYFLCITDLRPRAGFPRPTAGPAPRPLGHREPSALRARLQL